MNHLLLIVIIHLSIPIPPSSNCSLPIFHLNLASLSLHKDELVTSLSLLEIEFDMIALTETRIRAGIDPSFLLKVIITIKLQLRM